MTPDPITRGAVNREFQRRFHQAAPISNSANQTIGRYAKVDFCVAAGFERDLHYGPEITRFKLRMDQHCSNALAIAEWLEKHPSITWVKYPGLCSSPYYSLARKYLPQGSGSVITFGIKGGWSSKKLIDSIKLFSDLANLGDAKSFIIHAAATVHQQ